MHGGLKISPPQRCKFCLEVHAACLSTWPQPYCCRTDVHRVSDWLTALENIHLIVGMNAKVQKFAFLFICVSPKLP